MNKKLKFIIIVTAIHLVVLFLIPGIYFNYKVEHYTPRTFEEVFTTEELKIRYGVYENKSPADYGFKNFEEHTYKSEKDGLTLRAWNVPSEIKTDKCILMIHGRGANKLRTMKYLPMLQKAGLLKTYNVFMPDLRNSGKSDSAHTLMGYEFAEDIYYTIQYLNEKLGKKEFILYAFSMGAMGTMSMLDRNELYGKLKEKGIVIKRILFDSPICNSIGTLLHDAHNKKGLPSIITTFPIMLLKFRKPEIKKLRLHRLYGDKTIPLFIIQSEEDPTTPAYLLKEELSKIDNPNVKAYFFKQGLHVRSYHTKENRKKYIELATAFLKGK